MFKNSVSFSQQSSVVTNAAACYVYVGACMCMLSCSKYLQPHGLKHTRLPCPSLCLWVCSHSCPLSQWCYPTISPSVAPFSSCPQSFSTSKSFPMSRLFLKKMNKHRHKWAQSGKHWTCHTNTIQFVGRRQYDWTHIMADFEMYPQSSEPNL